MLILPEGGRVSSRSLPVTAGVSYFSFGNGALAHSEAIHEQTIHVYVPDGPTGAEGDIVQILNEAAFAADFPFRYEPSVTHTERGLFIVQFSDDLREICGCPENRCSCCFLGGEGGYVDAPMGRHFHDQVVLLYILYDHWKRYKAPVTVHEGGHAIGMGHSTIQGVMYPILQPGVWLFDPLEGLFFKQLLDVVDEPPQPGPEPTPPPPTPPAPMPPAPKPKSPWQHFIDLLNSLFRGKPKPPDPKPPSGGGFFPPTPRPRGPSR